MAGPQAPPRRPSILRCIAIAALTLIVLLGLVVLISWLVVRPKALEFSVDDARVHGFNVTNHALNATFDLTLRSYNRNRRVSFYYDAVEVSVWYDDQMLAVADAAPFYQPRLNVTTLGVSAAAQGAPLLSSVEKSLKRERSSGGVGLVVKVEATIRLKVGEVKTKHYGLTAFCSPVLVHFPAATEFVKVPCDVDI